MKFNNYKPKKQHIILLVIFIISIYITKQIEILSKDPTGDKKCDYIIEEFRKSAPNFIEFSTISIPNNLEIVNRNSKINDASCLNETTIWGVAKVKSIEEIKTAVIFANENQLKITPFGARHSMGGQSFLKGGLSIDFSSMKNITFDQETETVTLDPGVTWSDLLKYVDKIGYSVQVMQAYDVFTVASSISVNGHGLNLNPSHIGDTVTSLKIINPEGSILVTSQSENKELLRNVIGGYGLFGIIGEIKLKLIKNENYIVETQVIKLENLQEIYEKEIAINKNIIFSYASMSVSPFSFFDEMILYKYNKSSDLNLKPISKNDPTSVTRFVVNFAKTGIFGKHLKYLLEKHISMETRGVCEFRNNLLTPEKLCINSHNQAMNGSLNFLKNNLKDTDILQEYFIPKQNFNNFIVNLKKIVSKNNANLLNGAIRFVNKDELSNLSYSRENVFAIVLYFNQKLNDKDSSILKQTTSELIDLSIENGGSFYLPYQLYYDKSQLQKAYPMIDVFLSEKKKFDRNEIFSNTWYEKYKHLD